MADKTLRELHDEREALVAERTRLSKELSDIKEKLDQVEREIVEALHDVGDAVVIGGRRYAPEQVVVPKVEDWDALYSWLLENKAPYVLQRRVSSTAYRDLLDSGEGPDGIVPDTIVRLSSRKV